MKLKDLLEKKKTLYEDYTSKCPSVEMLVKLFQHYQENVIQLVKVLDALLYD